MRHKNHTLLAYLPKTTIKDSTVPFRAFLGAILFVFKDVRVESGPFHPETQLEITKQDKSSKQDINDGTEAYPSY